MFIHRVKNLSLSKVYFWIIINLGVILPIRYAKAGCAPISENCINNPLRADTFAQLIVDIANIVMAIAFPITVIFLIWAGYLFVSARGNEEKLRKAKSTFFWAIVGALILLGAIVIAEAIRATILSL